MSAAPCGSEESVRKVDPKAVRRAAQALEAQRRADEKADRIAAAAAQNAETFGHRQPAGCLRDGHLRHVPISAISTDSIGMHVVIRARLATVRNHGGIVFVTLRDGSSSLCAKATISDLTPRDMLAFISHTTCESVVDVSGMITSVETTLAGSPNRPGVELSMSTFHVVSLALSPLPFPVETPKHEDPQQTNLSTRLSCRWIDMRSQASNAIFKIQSRVGQYFREFLIDNDFTEIHTPKFDKVGYGGRDVRQPYMQMAVQGDLKRVFEVGPVFRAENSNTHRHLTEFVGLDMEMTINEHYYEVLDVAEALFGFMFTKLVKHTKELDAIRSQYTFDDLVFQVTPETIAELGIGIIDESVPSTDEYLARIHNRDRRMIRVPYAKCIALLNSVASCKLLEGDSLNVVDERLLGVLIKKRYGVDWFVRVGSPLEFCRPSTMPSDDARQFGNSFAFFVRGKQVSSGAQRRTTGTDAAVCRGQSGPHHHRALSDALQHGAWPHGGCSTGLERTVMALLDLPNIRFASMFPRNPLLCADP